MYAVLIYMQHAWYHCTVNFSACWVTCSVCERNIRRSPMFMQCYCCSMMMKVAQMFMQWYCCCMMT